MNYFSLFNVDIKYFHTLMNRNFEEFKNNTKDLFYFLINIKIYTEEK